MSHILDFVPPVTMLRLFTGVVLEVDAFVFIGVEVVLGRHFQVQNVSFLKFEELLVF